MKLKKVGFFRELGFVDSDSPSICLLAKNEPAEDESQIINYLRSGVMFIVSPGMVKDVLCAEGPVIGTPSIRTDGAWAWRDDLAHYVERYHVQLPSDFLSHVEARNFTPPPAR
jgi:hypothetical protein